MATVKGELFGSRKARGYRKEMEVARRKALIDKGDYDIDPDNNDKSDKSDLG